MQHARIAGAGLLIGAAGAAIVMAASCANTAEQCDEIGWGCDCYDSDGDWVDCRICSGDPADCDCYCDAAQTEWLSCGFDGAPIGSCSGGGGGGGAGGAGGSGGGDPCGGCEPPTSVCDEQTGTCVECLEHADCTEAAAAQCDGGACVACQSSAECAGMAAGEVCDDGTCVECAVDDDTACTISQTCDLVAGACVDVTAHSVANCHACTNDEQCESGHRCIPMEFEGSAYGYCCLGEIAQGCTQPIGVPVNRQSINGAAETDYCGIDEERATCEAVLALMSNWRCTGADGMCGPNGQPEVAVPGAICRKVGTYDNRCTYACAGPIQCPDVPPQDTCGDGDHSPPGWCGG